MAAATLLLVALGRSNVALGVALGGVAGAANFWLNAWLIRRLFDPTVPTRGSGVLLLLKNATLWLGVGALLLKVKPNGFGFGAGFSSILATVTIWALLHSFPRTGERRP